MATSDRSVSPRVLERFSTGAGKSSSRVRQDTCQGARTGSPSERGPSSRRRGRRWIGEPERMALEIQHT